MKKTLIAMLAVVLLIAAGCATSSDMPAEKAGKSGGESAVQEQKAADEKVPVTRTVNIPYLVKETGYFSDGYVESYTVISFNDDMTPAREDLFDSFDEIIESVVYEKVSDTEVKRSLYNARGELQSWKKLVSDGDGRLVLTESYNSEDIIQTSSEWGYGPDGDKTSWKVFDKDGVLLSDTEYKYDNGDNTRIEIYDASMKLREYFENTYKDGMLAVNRHFDENGKVLATVEYSYSDGALVEEKHMRANGSTSETIKYTNDRYGSPVKTEFFDGNNKLKDWNEKEYEYFPKEVTVWN